MFASGLILRPMLGRTDCHAQWGSRGSQCEDGLDAVKGERNNRERSEDLGSCISIEYGKGSAPESDRSVSD